MVQRAHTRSCLLCCLCSALRFRRTAACRYTPLSWTVKVVAGGPARPRMSADFEASSWPSNVVTPENVRFHQLL